jgi:hypothetical protein
MEHPDFDPMFGNYIYLAIAIAIVIFIGYAIYVQ